MKIATIVGARPQFIKAAVVSRALAEHNRLVTANSSLVTEVIIHTGQHYDQNMSDVFFEEMHIPKPDYFLDINGLSHGAMTGQMLEKIEAVLLDEKPGYVLVYGDTNTTLAGALAAVKLHIPVAHVEAGLRSFNRSMPEEINRVLTDHVSTLLFCPTQQAVQNLANEGIGGISSLADEFVSSSAPSNQSPITNNPSPITDNQSPITNNPSPITNNQSPITDNLSPEMTNLNPNCLTSSRTMSYELPPKVALVGDVMLDAALFYKKFARKPQIELPSNFILSTIHRAENTDNADRLKSIFKGLEIISREVPIILPLHPRTQKKISEFNLEFSDSSIIGAFENSISKNNDFSRNFYGEGKAGPKIVDFLKKISGCDR